MVSLSLKSASAANLPKGSGTGGRPQGLPWQSAGRRRNNTGPTFLNASPPWCSVRIIGLPPFVFGLPNIRISVFKKQLMFSACRAVASVVALDPGMVAGRKRVAGFRHPKVVPHKCCNPLHAALPRSPFVTCEPTVVAFAASSRTKGLGYSRRRRS